MKRLLLPIAFILSISLTIKAQCNLGLSVQINPHAYPTCGSPVSGALTAEASQGAPPYFYAWNTGATVDSLSNLGTGTYSVTVTDSLACTATAIYNLHAQSGFSVSVNATTASCTSNSVGSATISVSNGTPPYAYLWGTTPPQTTQTATGLHAGNCTFTVSDATGCSVVSTVNIVFTSFSFYTYVSVDTAPNCGIINGVVSAHTYNGTGPYSYHWSNNQTTATIANLNPGQYYVSVTDAGGCFSFGSAGLPYSCFNTITGKVFYDLNSNCVFDSSENSFYGITVSADNGNQTFYGYTDNAGNYRITVTDTGVFNVQASFSYTQTCGNITPCGSSVQPVSFHQFGQAAANINYGFTGSAGFDLWLRPAWSSANPGFDKVYKIWYGNQSPLPLTGEATLTFAYDPNLVYLSSDPPLPTHDAATHTLSWKVNPDHNWHLRGYCRFNVPASLSASYNLISDFYIAPTTGDCDSSNNSMHFSEAVTSSHDPNEKEVSPEGSIYEEDSVLTYTIRFQNTGTDTTWFVIVKDILSHNLDPLTVRNLASSHPYSDFNISGDGVLTWVFNPIYLVDSNTNEPASHGFIMFSIKKKKNLPIGTTISNNAQIYFDYNQPVVTNTVVNTLAEPTYVFEVHSGERVSVTAFPNPFSQTTNIVVTGLNEKFDFILFDVTGRVKKSIAAIEGNRFEMQRDDLAAGVYFYKISTGKRQVAYGKLVVQ